MSGTAAISSIAIIPQGARLHSVSPGHGQALQRIAQVVRPDLVFVDRGEDLGPDDFVIVGGPRLFGDVRDARARGFGQTALLFPEAVTSYYDSWSFPLELIHRSGAGRMTVALPDFERFVMGLSGLFGRFENGIYCHELSRYQAFDRVSNPDKESRLAECLALLADRQSQVSLLAVLKSERIELWRYWLSNLFNGSEYFDVLNIREGDIVMNAGVHGGGEIPHFLARIGDTGRVVNIDPLGDAYLGDFVKTAVLAFAGRCDFVAAALHDEDGALDLPVGASGMAAGGRIGEKIPGLATCNFAGRSIDSIAAELDLPHVDLIKMDIEGAEPRALAGSLSTIKRFRPQLAISIYHEPDHFLDIPRFLGASLENYRFYVRNYHFISNETILYAVPGERSPAHECHGLHIEMV